MKTNQLLNLFGVIVFCIALVFLVSACSDKGTDSSDPAGAPPPVTIIPPIMNFDSLATTQKMVLYNITDSTIDWVIDTTTMPTWVSNVAPVEGTIDSIADTVTITIDTTGFGSTTNKGSINIAAGDTTWSYEMQYNMSPCPAAARIIEIANDSLGSQMFELLEVTLLNPDSTFRPREVDFSGLYGLYVEASNLCPDNIDAKFGMAFTGMMVFLQDQNLNDFIDRMKYSIDTLSASSKIPFDNLPRLVGEGSMTPAGIPLASGKFLDAMPELFAFDRALMKVAATDPTISEFQTIIETSLLPKVTESRGYMNQILAQPYYTFTITPLMQGNPGGSNVVLDKSDFQAIQASLYAAEAWLHIFFARDLDVSQYNDVGATEVVNQNSSFLSLKPSNVGLVHMQTAKSRILSAATHFDLALDNLIDEVGTDQFNDFIQVYPNDLDDLNEIKDSLAHYRDFFNGSRELSVVYNEEYYFIYDGYYDSLISADTLVTLVDISKFFDNPMDNPKKFIPNYTVTITSIPKMYKSYADQYFSRDRYWAAMDSIFGLTYPNDTAAWSGDTLHFMSHLPDENSDEFYRLLGTSDWSYGSYTDIGYRQFLFGWSDVYDGNAYDDPRYIWSYYSDKMWEFVLLYRSPDQYEVCSGWEANSFAEWSFPDPTFNGLLPSMTNGELKDLMTDTDSWEKASCDTIDFD